MVTQTEKAFARKLFHISESDRREIDNEVRSMKTLCGNGTHKNIVSFLKFGELPKSSYYFIDMKLCDLNLIHRADTAESIPYFIKDSKHHKSGIL